MKRVLAFLFFIAGVTLSVFLILYKNRHENYVISLREFVDVKIKTNPLSDDFLAIKELNKGNGSYAFLYYGDDNGLYYHNPKGENIILNKPLLDKYRNGFAFVDYELENKGLYVVQWLRNPPVKRIILIKTNIDGTNPKYVLMGDVGEPLGKPKIVGDGKGNFLVAWADESQGYGVAYALLKGDKVEKQEIIRPAIAFANLEVYTPFYNQEEGFMLVYTNDKEIRVRRISDGQEKVLYSFGPSGIQNKSVHVLGKKDRLDVYVWSYDSLDPYANYRLTYLSYKNPMAEPLEKKEASYDRGTPNIMPIYDYRGFAFFTSALPEKNKNVPKDEDEKLLGKRINVVFSAEGKGYVRAVEGDKFNDYTYSQLYLAHASTRDSVMVVFLDRRYILPQIWMSYIRDGKVVGYGPIEKPWVETPVFGSVVHVKDSIYRVYYLHKKQDGRTVLRAVDIDGEKLHNPYPYPSLSEREKRLKEDLERFSQCQVKNDLECIYSYFDPVAQQKYPFGTFKQNAENFKVEIKEYTCKGKVLKDSFIAWVQCEYTYKLPPRFMGIEIREQDRQRKDKSSGYWVYIKDQWRMVFQSFPGMNLIQW